MSRSRGHVSASDTDGRALRPRERGAAMRIVERSLGVVAAIGAAVAILMARSSTLVNREIAWTSSSAAEARPLPRAVRFADSTTLFTAVDRYVERQRREGRVPGLALALVHGGRIVHERGFGVADPAGRPVTPATPFILGSMTKSFTALAVMQLVEQGRVVLDAPVQRYLPWFALRDSAASARITVRQLLNHTSGIPKSAGLEIVRSAEARTVPQERSLLAGVGVTHAPGAVFEYSNANYWILGRILEAVTDTPYAAYVHEHILAPLGMSHTYTNERDARRDGLAQGYRVWFGFPRPEDLPYYERELAVGYLISTAHDMGRYLTAQLNAGSDGGAPVLSAAGLEAMHTPPHGSPYGMGWLTDVVVGVPVVWHTGAVANYHGDMLIIPSTGWGVVQLANTNNFVLEGQLSQSIDGIAALLLGYEPAPAKGLGFRATYLLIVLACLTFAAWRVAQLIGLRHWRGAAHASDLRTRPPRRVVNALIDPGLSIGVLAGVPLLVTAPVSTLSWFVPDLTTWLLVNALASLAVLAARLAFALQTPARHVAASSGNLPVQPSTRRRSWLRRAPVAGREISRTGAAEAVTGTRRGIGTAPVRDLPEGCGNTTGER